MLAATGAVEGRAYGSGGGDSKKILRLLDHGPFEECVDDLELVVERLGRRRKPLPLLRRSSSVDKSGIVNLNSRVVDLAREVGLAIVLAVFALRGVLVRKKKTCVCSVFPNALLKIPTNFATSDVMCRLL